MNTEYKTYEYMGYDISDSFCIVFGTRTFSAFHSSGPQEGQSVEGIRGVSTLKETKQRIKALVQSAA